MRELDVSGPTSLATVKLESGGSEYVRLYVREDGVVVARDMLDVPDEQTAKKPDGGGAK